MNDKNLVQLRERTGLTSTALAAKAGISHAVLWRIEAGERSARADTLRKIADALSVELKQDVGGILKLLTDPA